MDGGYQSGKQLHPAASQTLSAWQGTRPAAPPCLPAVADPEAGVEPVVDRSIQAREAARKKAEAARQEEADRKQREAEAAAEAKRKQEEADRAAAEAQKEEERQAAEENAAAEKKAAEEKAAAEKKAAEEKAAAEKKAAATPAAEKKEGAATKKPSPPPKGGAKPAAKALPEGGWCAPVRGLGAAMRPAWAGEHLRTAKPRSVPTDVAPSTLADQRVLQGPSSPPHPARAWHAEDMTTEMTDEDLD